MTAGGSLDSTFGSGTGYYLSPVKYGGGTGLSQISFAVTEKDGSILAAGPSAGGSPQSFGVIHLLSNGTLDTSFGQNGQANVVSPTGYGFDDSPSALILLPDGKILVAGVLFGGSAGSNGETALARFDANGQPDTTFGTNGIAILNTSSLGASSPNLGLFAVQPDGKIIIAGTTTINAGDFLVDQQIAAVRLNSDGSVDSSFGTNGLAQFSDVTPGTDPTGTAADDSDDGVTVEPDGQILILAHISFEGSGLQQITPELFRLNSNGSRDTTFSEAGLQASGLGLPSTNGLLLQPDGQILVLGHSGGNASNVPVLARLNADGSLDRTATFPGTPSPTDAILGIAIEPDGDIALTGSGLNTSEPILDTFEAIQLTPNLTPNTSFGEGGIATIVIPSSVTNSQQPLSSMGLAVEPNNQIVLFGANPLFSGDLVLPPDHYAVLRLTSAGAADQPGDYTGDGLADPTIYVPSIGSFAIRPSQGGPDIIVPFGIAGAGQTIPAPGDYTGAGITELAAYLPSQGVYAIRPAQGGPDTIVSFGIAGPGQSIPAPGDYFGTGQDDIAVYMPSIGAFAIRNPAGGPDAIIPFGLPGMGQSIPVPGDYDGSGKTELAVYMPSLADLAYRPANGGPDVFEYFGIPGAGQTLPMPGDYDGSGKTEVAAYLPSSGVFAYRPANRGPDLSIPFGIPGVGQTLPAPGDYDGSGLTELAAYLPLQGVFAYRPGRGGPDVLQQFGIAGTGQSSPATVVVEAQINDPLDFVPEMVAKKRQVGSES